MKKAGNKLVSDFHKNIFHVIYNPCSYASFDHYWVKQLPQNIIAETHYVSRIPAALVFLGNCRLCLFSIVLLFHILIHPDIPETLLQTVFRYSYLLCHFLLAVSYKSCDLLAYLPIHTLEGLQIQTEFSLN